MKEFKANLKILKVEKRNNSYYGNPSYQLTVQTEDGEILVGKTATNAILGYEVSWTWEGDWKVLAYHFTKSGNCIFDRLTKLDEPETTIEQIEKELTDDLEYTKEQHQEIINYLNGLQKQGKSLKEIREMCWEDSNAIFQEIFG